MVCILLEVQYKHHCTVVLPPQCFSWEWRHCGTHVHTHSVTARCVWWRVRRVCLGTCVWGQQQRALRDPPRIRDSGLRLHTRLTEALAGGQFRVSVHPQRALPAAARQTGRGQQQSAIYSTHQQLPRPHPNSIRTTYTNCCHTQTTISTQLCRNNEILLKLHIFF